MLTRMQQRRGVASQWTDANPVLGSGEIGFEEDNAKFKVGDGLTVWTVLPYFENAADVAIAIQNAVDGILDLPPETLDTLNELSAALGDDPDFFNTVVYKAGSVMTGDLTLANDPTSGLHAATKQYVDGVESQAPGGTTNQALTKASDTDYDVQWTTIAFDLNGLSDVDTTGVEDKNTLVYETGTGWVAGPGGGRFAVAESPPIDSLNGDTWLDSSSGNTYIYYVDGDSNQWIQISGPNTVPHRGASLFVQTTAPGAPVEGDLWYDPTEGFTYIYYTDIDSSQWIQFGLNRNGAPGEISKSDLLTFDGSIVPDTDDTYNLGAPAYRWANVYTADFHLRNSERNTNTVDGTWGDYTIQEGQDDLFLINHRTGKRYSFVLKEIEDSEYNL